MANAHIVWLVQRCLFSACKLSQICRYLHASWVKHNSQWQLPPSLQLLLRLLVRRKRDFGIGYALFVGMYQFTNFTIQFYSVQFRSRFCAHGSILIGFFTKANQKKINFPILYQLMYSFFSFITTNHYLQTFVKTGVKYNNILIKLIKI